MQDAQRQSPTEGNSYADRRVGTSRARVLVKHKNDIFLRVLCAAVASVGKPSCSAALSSWFKNIFKPRRHEEHVRDLRSGSDARSVSVSPWDQVKYRKMATSKAVF